MNTYWYSLCNDGFEIHFRKSTCDLDTALSSLCGGEYYKSGVQIKIGDFACYTSKSRTEMGDVVYEQATRAIELGRLPIHKGGKEEITRDEPLFVIKTGLGSNPISMVPGSTCSDYQVLIIDVLQWMILEKISVSPRILTLLRLRSSFEWKLKNLVLQATAQAIWNQDPGICITKMARHPIIEEVLGRTYKSKNTVRDIIKLVDPRPKSKKGKPKKQQDSIAQPYPPKPIPGVFFIDTDETWVDFLALRAACKALINALMCLGYPVQTQQWNCHSLVGFYLEAMSEMVKDISLSWAAEVEASFPLSFHSFK